MSVKVPRAIATTPLGALLPLMGDTDVEAVPILENGKLIGIVIRTDLIAAMARGLARESV
ncbi:CBS domain-containing protein (plasmid) [Rhizobium sp. SSM4.3]|uniref:CBS domain-containing protein n=2 Tax=Peteryoungia algae TaxID=2919917 RepID=A0ABT0D5P8_9HYPH|nr:CBS domain-containing protein [Rhizobium sp. SSM4.3]MCJ8240720.1 CBS domain-containing protein [Rhizobium sp. SSM4.3]